MKRILLIALPVVLLVITIVLIFNLRHARVSSYSTGAGIGSVSALLAEGKDLEAKGKLLDAKAVYQKLVNEYPSSRDVLSWQKKVEAFNIKLIFSDTLLPNLTSLYEIKPGDTLGSISKQFNTNIELIMKSNRLSSDRIIPGRKVRIWTAPFTILVDKSQNTLTLKTGDEIIKTYSVSTGANNCTPVGTFKIVELIANPPWFKPGATEPIPPGSPQNILGTRWLGINVPGYGIHGTTDPGSLGSQVTQGCVRMANSDVEELFALVPKGTEVDISD